jgi:hypothetical protein
MPGRVTSVLVSSRLPEPTLTFMSRRSVSENDNCVALRKGPVPLGTDGGSVTPAATARPADVAGVAWLVYSHVFVPDFGETTGSIRGDTGPAAAGPPETATSDEAANSAVTVVRAARTRAIRTPFRLCGGDHPHRTAKETSTAAPNRNRMPERRPTNGKSEKECAAKRNEREHE